MPAHHSDVSRFGLTFVAETIPVGHHPFAHIGDDFHVGVRMGRKACIWSDLGRGPPIRQKKSAVWPLTSRYLGRIASG